MKALKILTTSLNKLFKTSNRITTSSLEKSGELFPNEKVTVVSSPYGRHIANVSIDIFGNGIYLYLMKNEQAIYSKFIHFREFLENNEQKEKR